MTGYLDKNEDYRWLCKHTRSVINNEMNMVDSGQTVVIVEELLHRLAKFNDVFAYKDPIGPAICSLYDVMYSLFDREPPQPA